MRRAIREFLERKLQALEEARAEGRDGNDLPGKILFGPAPKNAVEAKLHGILEGLYVAGKINGSEASDWHSRFRKVLAVPGDPGVVVAYIGDDVPADVRAQLERQQPWPTDSMILAIELDIPAHDYDSGLLVLTRVELFPLGISLHWRLELSERARAAVDKARRALAKSPPDLFEFHLTRTMLPSPRALSVSDVRGAVFEVLDMDSGFSRTDRIWAITRLTPLPELPAELAAAWAGRRFAFSLDGGSPGS